MRRTKADTEVTYRSLLQIARDQFAEHGYAGTSLEAIVQAANMTRGAVYHHFRNKQELFRCVLADIHQEVSARIEQGAAESDDVWEQLKLGCRAFILAAVEPRNQRIMLIDGPSILGGDVWREMDHAHSMRLLHAQLELMQQQGWFNDLSIEALTHFISGGLNETAIRLALQPDLPSSLQEAMAMIDALLEGLRLRS